MPKLIYRCCYVIGDEDSAGLCNAPAARCGICKRPFCRLHYDLHDSRQCWEEAPRIFPIRDLDDPSEEVAFQLERLDDEARQERNRDDRS